MQAGVFASNRSKVKMANRPNIDVTSMSLFTDETTNEPELIDDISAEMRPDKEETSHLLEVGLAINKYATPTILTAGLVGNILTLMLMQRPFMKNSTSAIYFSALAVGDSLRLLIDFTQIWLPKHAQKDPWFHNDITCKIQQILSAVSYTWPAWIIVAMTAERLVAVRFPFRAKGWLTVKVASAVCVVITFLSFVLWSVVFLFDGVSTGPCDTKLLWKITEQYVLLLATTLYTYVPTPLLIVMNTVIVRQLIGSRKQHDKMTTTIGSANSKISRITVMAVTVSLVYLVLTVPACVFTTLDFLVIETGKLSDITLGDKVRFCREVFDCLSQLNHAINFFLYLLILPKVRYELVNMWRSGTAAACLSAKPGAKDKTDDTPPPLWSTKKTDVRDSTQ